MNWLRKLIVALVLGAATLTQLPSDSRAEAHAPSAHARFYAVYYRTCVDSPWVFYYSCWRHSDAQRYANYIANSYGYQTFVRSVH